MSPDRAPGAELRGPAAESTPPTDSAGEGGRGPAGAGSSRQRGPAEPAWIAGARRIVLLTLLCSLPAISAMRSRASVTDPDIWWHLATGDWIRLHHALPATDPFSAGGAGKALGAYSWLFELAASWAFARLGFMGLFLLQAALVTLIAIALHRLLGRLLCGLVGPIALTGAALIAMAHIDTPRPWLVTILLFVLELQVIEAVRGGESPRKLLWLPPIFALWANVHIQFVYGLFVLILVTGVAWWEWYRRRDPTARGKRNRWTGVALASLAATALNPYSLGIYGVAYGLGAQRELLDLVTELRSIPFRSVPDYAALLIGLGGVAALAWWRSADPFRWLVLLWAIAGALRSRRDVWLVAIVGVTTIAAVWPRTVGVIRYRPSRLEWFGVACGVLLTLACAARLLSLSDDSLKRAVAERYPVKAVEAVRSRRLGGPLYNGYDWGGYLIWSLPELPVSIDGRSNVHPIDRMKRSLATWDAKHDWALDPELQRARLVIGPLDAPLCALLRIDPRYAIVYEDEVASVFTRRGP